MARLVDALERRILTKLPVVNDIEEIDISSPKKELPQSSNSAILLFHFLSEFHLKDLILLPPQHMYSLQNRAIQEDWRLELKSPVKKVSC